jgi:hypothetical protein
VRGLLLLALGVVVVVAGCTQPPGPGGTPPPSNLTPEQRIQAALQGVEADFGPSGGARRLTGSFLREGISMALDIEFGSNQVTSLTFSLGPLGGTIFCREGTSVFRLGNQTAEGRSIEGCTDLSKNLTASEEGAIPAPTSQVLSTQPAEGGGLSATVKERNRTGAETLSSVRIGPDNKLLNFTTEDDSGTGSFTIVYGPRRAIQVPAATDRFPASIEFELEHGSGNVTWLGKDQQDRVPLAEFEARLLDGQGDVAVAFPLTPGAQAKDGFNFTFTDNGDGILGKDDRFVVEHARVGEYEVTVYDKWASRALGDNPIPGPGAALLLAALGLLALALRRPLRRR